jgi:ZIP family zinc transporter
MLIVGIAIAAFCATLAGGIFALRLRDKLHLVLGFSAGAVVAVAFFDLLPEAINLGRKFHEPITLLSVTGLGFLLYMILDRIQVLHGQHALNHAAAPAPAIGRGVLGAGSLSAHSFLDGISIGFAFQASAAVGMIVTIAVLTHDFSDGINTTNVVLKNGGSRRQALQWLLLDAIAPAAGIGSTFFFVLPEAATGLVLALFAGFFLYIGASDLIPESHHAHPKFLTTVMTLLGAGVLYGAITLIGR